MLIFAMKLAFIFSNGCVYIAIECGCVGVGVHTCESIIPRFFPYRIPTLQELGFSATETLFSNKGWIGGETMALQRLIEYCHVRSQPPSENYVS